MQIYLSGRFDGGFPREGLAGLVTAAGGECVKRGPSRSNDCSSNVLVLNGAEPAGAGARIHKP